MGFVRTLTAEQLRNVRHLHALKSGASFSVPGAGKTTEALAFFLLNKTVDTRLLVISPKNAFAVWEEQTRECAPSSDIDFVRLTSGELGVTRKLGQEPLAMLITYQQFSILVDLIAGYLSRYPSIVILDESH